VLSNDDSPEPAPDPDPDDPTAPGLLNRAALRQVDLSTSEAPGTAETSAESGPPDGSEAGGSDASDASDVFETETETEAAGTGAREADPATEAERRART
jgi:hypothetical protein